MHYDIMPVDWSSETRIAESRRRAAQRRLVSLANGRGHNYPRRHQFNLSKVLNSLRDGLHHARRAHEPARPIAR